MLLGDKTVRVQRSQDASRCLGEPHERLRLSLLPPVSDWPRHPRRKACAAVAAVERHGPTGHPADGTRHVRAAVLSWNMSGLDLRALHASGQLDAYWEYHLQQEFRRNHTTRYQEGFSLTA
jgi:hypothetical protein